MKKSMLSVALSLAALILNPMVACQDTSNGSDEQYNFGESEMRQTVVGTYTGTVQSTGETVIVTVTQASNTGNSTPQSVRSPQCGTRSFVKTASACMSSTTMTLTAHLSSTNPSLGELDLTGKFDVYGSELSNGTLMLSEADGGYLSASYDDSIQGFGDWTLTNAQGSWVIKLTKQ
jgi:hypothetical protein